MSDGYLLDTNVVIGFAFDPERFRSEVRALLLAPHERLVISVVSAFEMAVKLGLGKLRLPEGFQQNFEGEFRELQRRLVADTIDVRLPHAARVLDLPFHHRDPFDRLLIAQALEEDLTLVSTDRQFAAYQGLKLLLA